MITIGPSTVGFSGAFHGSGGGIGSGPSMQRELFEAHSLIWAFYSLGSQFGYKTSPDGVSWPIDSIPITPETHENVSSTRFSLWFDGTFVHTVHTSITPNVEYRRGLPQADGTIVWDNIYIVAPGVLGFLPSICCDSYGYPYIAYNEWNTTGRLYLVKSQAKNGTWVTAPGFPLEITSTAEVEIHKSTTDDWVSYPLAYWQAAIVPLTGGKLYVAYCFELNRIWGKVFDGSQLLADEMAMSRRTSEDAVWSIAAYGDTVYLAAHAGGIWMATRHDSWTQPVYLGATSDVQDSPSVSIGPDGNPYVFWESGEGPGSTMRYAYLEAGAWTTVDWFTGNFSNGWTLSSYYSMQGNKMGIIHHVNVSFPRYIEFAALATVGPSTHVLTISVDGGGFTTPGVGEHVYTHGSAVSILATPSSGWLFSHWESGGVPIGSVNPIDIDINSDYSVTAVFTSVPTQTLTMSATVGGSTDPPEGDHEYVNGATVQISATPDEGYAFSEWREGGEFLSAENPVSIIMDTDLDVRAVFIESSIVKHTVTVAISGSGTTSPIPGAYTIPEGDIFTVVATPASGWHFERWGGDASGTGRTLQFVVVGDVNVEAVFVEGAPINGQIDLNAIVSAMIVVSVISMGSKMVGN